MSKQRNHKTKLPQSGQARKRLVTVLDETWRKVKKMAVERDVDIQDIVGEALAEYTKAA